jgi:hypothetical protein
MSLKLAVQSGATREETQGKGKGGKTIKRKESRHINIEMGGKLEYERTTKEVRKR